MPAAAKKSGYAPIAQAEDEEAPRGPKPQLQPKVSGVDASGHAEAHWSGLSYEEARDFKNCPSDRIVFPEYSAGFFKFWSFQWLSPIMKLGNRTHLLESDVWAIHEAESCTTNAPPMAEFWAREKKAAAAAGREPTVIWPIFWTVRRRMGIAGAWKVLGDIFKLVNPLILQQILLVVEGGETFVARERAWLLAVLLFCTTWMQIIIDQRYMYFSQRVGFRTQCAMISVLYRQILQLTPGARAAYSSGKIANLMSTDCAKVQTCVSQFNHLWLVPTHFLLALSLLIYTVGIAGLAGLATILLLIPLGKKLVAKLKELRKQALQCTDERLKLITEALTGIRIVKYMAWEPSLVKKIDAVRTRELALLRRAAIFKAANFTLMASSPMLICIATLTAYGAMGNELTASTAFTAFALLNLLKQPIEMMPRVITDVFVDGRVSMARISTFLSEPPQVEYVKPMPDGKRGELVLDIHSATFAWQPLPKKLAWSGSEGRGRGGRGRGGGGRGRGGGGPKKKTEAELEAEALLKKAKQNQGRPVLNGISLAVERGQLVCIVGGVGSGKSSLIHGILGEMALSTGEVSVGAKLAYSPQSSFTLNTTLRENIVFGLPFIKADYETVVSACSLAADFEQLPTGDLSQIGENGITLSGGQKQRVGLARSVYAAIVGDAEMLLLDDPLSAVDAHVGAHIFEECILGLLKSRSKTVVMPVHNLQFLQHADRVVCLHPTAGTISEQGGYSELLQAGGEFAAMMEKYASVSRDDEVVESPRESKKTTSKESATAASKKKKPEKEKDGKLMTVEERAVGSVDTRVWLYYFKMCGLGLSWIVLFCYIFGQSAKVLTDWWMSRWAVADTSVLLIHDESWTPTQTTAGFLSVYGLLGVGVVVLNGIKTVVVCVIGLRAAKKLHANMLQSLLRAPTSFFDMTPVGRIVNRFSSDMQSIDMGLTDTFITCAEQLFTIIGVFAVVLVVFLPFIVLMIPLFVFYSRMQRRYRNASRELKRLTSITKSPIFSHFGETLAGLTCVRAYNEQTRFALKNDGNINNNMRFQLVMMTAGRWMGFQLNLSAALIVFIVALSITLDPDTIDAGTTGLALTYAMMCTRTLGMIIRSFTDLELQMNSIERVKYYIDVEQEKPFELPSSEPPAHWPRNAAVEFVDVCARYRPALPLVVDGLTFSVHSGEKVGVVGRTGAGKSSMMLLLFRILELDSGRIEIDGIDIATLGLRRLRSAIAMLPQDPTLFAGSVRSNLDPFADATDAEVWEALHRAQMDEAVRALPAGLDSEVGEGGGSFSVGQRQLLCLARAVLRDSRLLVMDECTASVDVATDGAIQAMIREVFADCTIFAIAHRLATIIDYDHILVLEQGTIAESGHPADLLRDPDGQLSALVDQSGPSMAAHLRSVAAAAEAGRGDKIGGKIPGSPSFGRR